MNRVKASLVCNLNGVFVQISSTIRVEIPYKQLYGPVNDEMGLQASNNETLMARRFFCWRASDF